MGCLLSRQKKSENYEILDASSKTCQDVILSKLANTARSNWLEMPINTVTERLLDFFSSEAD